MHTIQSKTANVFAKNNTLYSSLVCSIATLETTICVNIGDGMYQITALSNIVHASSCSSLASSMFDMVHASTMSALDEIDAICREQDVAKHMHVGVCLAAPAICVCSGFVSHESK